MKRHILVPRSVDILLAPLFFFFEFVFIVPVKDYNKHHMSLTSRERG